MLRKSEWSMGIEANSLIALIPIESDVLTNSASVVEDSSNVAQAQQLRRHEMPRYRRCLLPMHCCSCRLQLAAIRVGQYEFWSATHFSRQFVRRESADLLGQANFYNWREYAFVQNMKRTKDVCDTVFRSDRAILAGRPGLWLRSSH